VLEKPTEQRRQSNGPSRHGEDSIPSIRRHLAHGLRLNASVDKSLFHCTEVQEEGQQSGIFGKADEVKSKKDLILNGTEELLENKQVQQS
jgi:hypothetical protein